MSIFMCIYTINLWIAGVLLESSSTQARMLKLLLNLCISLVATLIEVLYFTKLRNTTSGLDKFSSSRPNKNCAPNQARKN